MSTSFLKGNRTRYRNLLEKEMEKGKVLISEAEQEQYETKVFNKNVRNCLRRINDFIEKLEQTNERLSVVTEGQDGAQEIEQLINDDWSYIAEVTDCRDELIEIQQSLQAQKSPSENWSSITVTEDRFNQMIQMTAQMQQVLIGQQQMQQQQQQQSQTEQSSHRNASTGNSVRLPKLEIPSFSGEKLKWTEFWDSFEAAVHLNTSLSDVEKLNYLMSKLTGEAKNSVSGILLSNENYPVAVDLLKERYGDKQVVVTSHYTELINLKQAPNNPKGLRYLYNQVEKHLRSLKALEQNTDQDLFISMITSKLPKEVLIQLEVQKGARTPWTVKELRERFNDYIAARERAEQHASTAKSESAGDHERHLTSSAEALVAGVEATDNKRERKVYPKCKYCDENHWSDECVKYATVEARKQRIRGSCYICLKSTHQASGCPQRVKCYYCRQWNRHHRSLCPKQFEAVHRETSSLAEELPQHNDVVNTENSLISSGEMVLMQTAKTDVKNPENGIKQNARILLDSGSQRTYITESLAKRLNLKLGDKDEFMLVTFGSEKPKRTETRNTKLDMVLKDGSILTIGANVVPQIAESIQRRPVNLKTLDNWDYLWNEFSLADDLPSERETSSVELLIGNDYYLDIILPQKMEVQPGLYMLGSKLGWILSGRTSELVESTTEPSMLILTHGKGIDNETTFMTCMDKSLPTKPNVEDFWRLESIGISDSPVESDNEVARKKFSETLKYEQGRYTVTWPWKEDRPDLPENRALALGRLKSLVTRMKNNPELIQKYDGIITDQLDRGIIEKVGSESNSLIKHYIPHHAVVNPTKATTKVRVVYDASARCKPENKSLNECLYRGPILLQNLTGILLRFRLNKIAVVADIEKAFLQIGLQDEAKDVTRFFWLKDKDKIGVENNIQMYRFCRVPFGIISSPFLLAATIDHHLKNCNSDVGEKIRENIYVDNVITGTQSCQEAVHLYNVSKQIFKGAAMNLRDWMSNNQEVLSEIPLDDRANRKNMKVLGLTWYIKEDCLALNSQIRDERILSKRTVLRQIASIYDPLGLYSPITLRGKLFLQSLWNQRIAWDKHLTEQDKIQWYAIHEDLKLLANCHFPRHIGFDLRQRAKYQLLVFCDASKYAYAAAVYLLQESQDCRRVDLIFSKTRLVPNKTITIPRLELLAALIGTRCMKFIEQELKVEICQKHIWLDSQCVLNWINSQRTLGTFVENRVKEIKSDKDIIFHYISTTENPADIASRGTSTRELTDNRMWWHGPDWLTQPQQNWPEWIAASTDRQKAEIQAEVESEYKNTKVMFEAKLIAGEGSPESKEAPFGMDIKRFSSFTKLCRVTAWVSRFIEKLRKETDMSGPLKATEISKAETMWTAYVQSTEYHSVINSFQKKTSNNLRAQLGLYMDNSGLIRCQGRLENAEICEGARYPLLLPKHHRYTELIIQSHHERALHTGCTQTLSLTRQKYWIPQGRAAVKRVLKQCTVCRRHEGGPYKMPLMPPIPTERVSTSAPFTYTGVDYFGPLFIKTKREIQKVWVCLYTCLVTRAIHLELMYDMTTQQFLLGFRRFIARHGKPNKIISDNAAQFKLASDTISKLWGQILTEEDTVSYAANENIQWIFTVALAPWMGGFYERLVGIVKRSLRKAIGKVCLNNEQLLTIIKEAEAVINSRPLVYVGDDINSYMTLTPAHFLTLNPKIGLPVNTEDDTDDMDYKPEISSADKLLVTWKKGLKHLSSFWKIWRDDYLLSLRERPQIKLKEPRVQSPFTANVGDVVLIKDDLPRGSWRLGRIQELIKSRDGHIRSATIVLPSNKTIGRPLSLLFPIECQDKEMNTDSQKQDVQQTDIRKIISKVQTEGKDGDASDLRRPMRPAASTARQRIKEQLRSN